MITIDTTNMCSHLQKKLFEEDGIYHSLWIAMQDDSELTAVVRSRQLHIYRNGKKVLVLAGKSAPKVIREDSICDLLQIERIKWMEQRFNNALAAIKDGAAVSLKAIKEDVAELSKYYVGICSLTIVKFKRKSNDSKRSAILSDSHQHRDLLGLWH